jgi:hypothetical protein
LALLFEMQQFTFGLTILRDFQQHWSDFPLASLCCPVLRLCR